MNKYYLSLSLFAFLFAIELSAQHSKPKKEYTQAEYLKQSKNANTEGLVLLLGGTATAILPLAIVDLDEPTDGELALVLATLAVGTVAIATSIPLFLSSASSERKAARLSIQSQTYLKLQDSSIISSSAPSIALKVTF